MPTLRLRNLGVFGRAGLTPPAACRFAIETWANECDFFSGGLNPLILANEGARTKTRLAARVSC